MLMTVNHVCIDTDLPEEYIEEVKTILPYGLQQSIGRILEEYKNFEDGLESSFEEGRGDPSNLDPARDVRDRVQTLLDALVENSTFDKDTLSAIKYIRNELDNI